MAPGKISLSAPAGELTVSWSAPRDDLAGRAVEGLSGYTVLRGAWTPGDKPCDTCPEDLAPVARLDGEERRARGLPETSWIDPDVRDGWTYRYRVRALDNRGRPGPASAPATLTWTPPAMPRVAATPGDGQATVRWEAGPLPAGLTPLGARVYGAQGQRLAEAGTDARETVVGGLENGSAVTLSVRLACKTPEGWDLESAGSPVTVTPQDTTAPVPPSDLVAFGQPGGVELRWLPAGSEPYAEVMVLRARESGSFEEIARLPGADTSYVDATAAPGQTYLYTVVALDARGNHSAPTREARIRVVP